MATDQQEVLVAIVDDSSVRGDGITIRGGNDGTNGNIEYIMNNDIDMEEQQGGIDDGNVNDVEDQGSIASEDESESEDEDDYDDDEFGTPRLSEENLRRIQNEDPSTTELFIRLPSRVEGKTVGRCVGESSRLDRLIICLKPTVPDDQLPQTIEWLSHFFEGLANNRSISELGLRGLVMGSVGSIMSPFFEHNCNLQFLEMSGCNFGPPGISFLTSALSRRSNKDSLQSITLSGCRIGDEPIAKLVNVLKEYGSLTHLLLGGNQVESKGCAALKELLSSSTNLKVLNLCRNSLSNEGISMLTNVLSSLRYLNIEYNRSISPQGWRTFFAGLKALGTTIEELDVSSNDLGDIGATALGDYLANTSELVKLTCDGLNHVSMSFISQTGWTAAFTCLRSMECSPVCLELSGSRLGEQGLLALGDALATNSTVKKLDLSNVAATAEAWFRFFPCFASPIIRVEDLNLQESSNITDESMAVFSAALAKNKTLSRLNLHGNTTITNVGWAHLSNIICNTSSMESISASNHTLCDIFCHSTIIPQELKDLMFINRYLGNGILASKDTARQKIMHFHFRNGSSNLEEFFQMKLKLLPQALSWIGKGSICNKNGPCHPLNSCNTDSTLVFQLLRSMPLLFEYTPANSCGVKRSSYTLITSTPEKKGRLCKAA